MEFRKKEEADVRKSLAAFVVMCGMLCAASTAYGAAEQVGSGAEVRVRGNAGEAGVPVAIEVYKGALSEGVDGTTLEHLDKVDYLSVLACHDQGMTDENGDYTFSFNINLPSGLYTVYTATPSQILPAEEFMYISQVDFKRAAELLNAATSSKETEAYIRQYPYELGLSPAALDGLKVSGLAAVLYETLKETPLDPGDRESAQLLVKKAVLVEKLNEGAVADLYEIAAAENGMVESAIAAWYQKSYVTDALKRNLTGRLNRQDISSYQQYLERLTDAFILATVTEPNGNGNVRGIMTEFAERIGIDPTKADSRVWSSLAGESFDSLPALAACYQSLCGKPAGTGSGSGGGSKGGSAGSVPSVGQVEISSAANEPVAGQKIPKEIFSDLAPAEWAKPAIVALAERGILSGSGDGCFRPNDPITREEFCKLVVEAFAPEAQEVDAGFDDVPDGVWYRPYVYKAYGEGFVKGLGNRLFGTGRAITRQDMSVILYRAAQAAGKQFEEGKDFSFDDDGQIAAYARPAVYALQNSGVISGVTASAFAPDALATRAQAAKMIYALIAD